MEKLKLTITLKNGRVLSGTYPYLAALARQEAAMKFPQCLSAEIGDES